MFVSFPNLYIETLSLNEMILEGQVFGKIIGFNSGHESEALVMEATPFFFLMRVIRDLFWLSALHHLRIQGKVRGLPGRGPLPHCACTLDRKHPGLRLVRNKFLLF